MFSCAKEDCGYDYEFVDEVPDTLLCIVCHLVLRDPVQIMTCGHRFCTPCFDRMKSYSKRIKADLTCPIDRKLVEEAKVFKDTAVSRDIGSLKVKCENNKRGCTWNGELRYLQDHQHVCKATKESSTKADYQTEMTSRVLDQIFIRLKKCEEELQKKEKERITYECDMNALKISHLDLEQELKSLKKKSQQQKEEIANLLIENSKQKKQITDTKIKLDGILEQNTERDLIPKDRGNIANLLIENSKRQKQITDTKKKLDGIIEQNTERDVIPKDRGNIANLLIENSKQKKQITDTKKRLDEHIEQNTGEFPKKVRLIKKTSLTME